MLAIATRELDRAFQRCSADLDVISSNLESEFDKNPAFSRVSSNLVLDFETSHPLKGQILQNPSKLLQRIKALEQDLPKVQNDWRKVMVAKQTLIDIAKAQQVSNFRLLRQMCDAVDVKV